MGRKGTENLLESFRAWLNEPIQRQMNDLARHHERQLKEMRKQMALDAAELKARINDATNNLAGDVATLKSKLEQALADQDVRIEGAVQEALSGLDVLATNLENLAASTPEDPTTDPEEPTPGEDPIDPTEPEPTPEQN